MTAIHTRWQEGRKVLQHMLLKGAGQLAAQGKIDRTHLTELEKLITTETTSPSDLPLTLTPAQVISGGTLTNRARFYTAALALGEHEVQFFIKEYATRNRENFERGTRVQNALSALGARAVPPVTHIDTTNYLNITHVLDGQTLATHLRGASEEERATMLGDVIDAYIQTTFIGRNNEHAKGPDGKPWFGRQKRFGDIRTWLNRGSILADYTNPAQEFKEKFLGRLDPAIAQSVHRSNGFSEVLFNKYVAEDEQLQALLNTHKEHISTPLQDVRRYHTIINRDLKPDNVMSEGKEWRILDWDLASYGPIFFDLHRLINLSGVSPATEEQFVRNAYRTWTTFEGEKPTQEEETIFLKLYQRARAHNLATEMATLTSAAENFRRALVNKPELFAQLEQRANIAYNLLLRSTEQEFARAVQQFVEARPALKNQFYRIDDEALAAQRKETPSNISSLAQITLDSIDHIEALEQAFKKRPWYEPALLGMSIATPLGVAATIIGALFLPPSDPHEVQTAYTRAYSWPQPMFAPTPKDLTDIFGEFNYHIHEYNHWEALGPPEQPQKPNSAISNADYCALVLSSDARKYGKDPKTGLDFSYLDIVARRAGVDPDLLHAVCNACVRRDYRAFLEKQGRAGFWLLPQNLDEEYGTKIPHDNIKIQTVLAASHLRQLLEARQGYAMDAIVQYFGGYDAWIGACAKANQYTQTNNKAHWNTHAYEVYRYFLPDDLRTICDSAYASFRIIHNGEGSMGTPEDYMNMQKEDALAKIYREASATPATSPIFWPTYAVDNLAEDAASLNPDEVFARAKTIYNNERNVHASTQSALRAMSGINFTSDKTVGPRKQEMPSSND